MEAPVAVVVQVVDRFANPPVGPVVESVPDKEGTVPPYVMLAAFAVAVTGRPVIESVPRAYEKDPIPDWVVGAEAELIDGVIT